MQLPDDISSSLAAVTASLGASASITITPSQGVYLSLSADKLTVTIRDWWTTFQIKEGTVVESTCAENTLDYLLVNGTFEEFLVRLQVIKFLLNDKSAAHSISNLAKGTVYR